MRILFIGCVQFSEEALGLLLSGSIREAQVVGVVTLEKSGFHSDFRSLGPLAESRGLPVFYYDHAKSPEPEMQRWISGLAPDVIYCLGWSKLLKRETFQAARLGAIGFHPAALPRNRGRHPLIWALALGLSETASSFFFMDEGADSGDLLSQRSIAITDDDDATSLYRKVIDEALDQLREFTPALSANRFTRSPQDHSMATYWRKRSRADGQIDWRMSARAIRNLVRALAKPYPGAHFQHQGRDVVVWKACETKRGPEYLEPGRILAVDPGRKTFTVQCGEGAIEILEHGLLVPPEKDGYL